METLQLVCLHWISIERDKYVWEDLYVHSQDEIIGRIYLLKAHSIIEQTHPEQQRSYYKEALTAFEPALTLFAKNKVSEDYYYRALADKAVVQCYLGQYDSVLADIDESLSKLGTFYQSILTNNRAVKSSTFVKSARLVCSSVFSFTTSVARYFASPHSWIVQHGLSALGVVESASYSIESS